MRRAFISIIFTLAGVIVLLWMWHILSEPPPNNGHGARISHDLRQIAAMIVLGGGAGVSFVVALLCAIPRVPGPKPAIGKDDGDETSAEPNASENRPA